MITAIDTSVLHAIFNGERSGSEWLERLVEARREGVLVLCPVVYAELAPSFAAIEDLDTSLDQAGVAYERLSKASAFLAGRLFRQYREAGGPREHMIPDFLIAAHAQVQADRLAAVDRGYLRRYFADLPLLHP